MKKKNMTLWIFKYIFILAMVFVVLAPALFTICNSFMGRREVADAYGAILGGGTELQGFAGFKIVPYQISFEQYINLLVFRPSYLQKYLNSVILTVPIVCGQVAISCLAAYAFAKLRFPFRDKLFFVYIVVMLMPYQVTLVPNYMVMDKLGLIGTFQAIILPGIFATFGVFLLRQFMHMIPDEYIEAGKIDGAGALRIFASIILPQCKSALAALTILSFIDNWNMVEQPIIMLGDDRLYPFSLLLAYINDKDITLAFASGVIYMIPVLCFSMFFHTYLIKGIQMSGMK